MSSTRRPSRRAVLGALSLSALMAGEARAAGCGPDRLGTARVIPVSTAGGLRVGRKSYPRTLPLAPGEVLLTFDDGPHPGTTEPILAALARECVKATFFMIGRQAAATLPSPGACSPRATRWAITPTPIR